MLKITEELFLLSLDDAKGRIHRSIAIPQRFTLGGALLADLFLYGKVKLNNQKEVTLGVEKLCNDPLIDDAFVIVKAALEYTRKVTPLLEAINPKPKKLLNYLAFGLVEQGILNFEERRYLWVIPYQVFSQQDPSVKYWIKEHLRGVVLAGDVADLHTLMVLNLLRSGGILNLVFTRDEMKAARERIQMLAAGAWDDPQAIDLAEEIHTAIMGLTAAAVSS